MTRCEVRGCTADAVGILRFESCGDRIDHPLCEPHSDPSFHLRKFGGYWTWVPRGEEGTH